MAKKRILTLIAAGLTLIASVVVSSASMMWLYQPKAPKSLRK